MKAGTWGQPRLPAGVQGWSPGGDPGAEDLGSSKVLGVLFALYGTVISKSIQMILLYPFLQHWPGGTPGAQWGCSSEPSEPPLATGLTHPTSSYEVLWVLTSLALWPVHM